MPVKPVQFSSPPQQGVGTRQYNRFRGVDFSTDPALVDRSRSPYALNIMSDSGGYPEKRPGWKTLHTVAAGQPVNGLHFLVDKNNTLRYVAHVGDALYTWDETAAAPVRLCGGMANAKSVSAVHNGVLYILDGARYIRYDGITAPAPVQGYIPTTVIGRSPAGGGTPYEAVNLIGSARRNGFIGDGGVKEVAQLQISSKPSASGNVSVTLGGATVTVAVLNTDSAAGVAAKIYNGTYTGWNKQLLGDTVIWTATAAGEKSDATFSAGTTGVLANMITLIQGTNPVTAFQLDTINLDARAADTPVTALVGSTAVTEGSGLSVDRAKGIVTFTDAPPSGNGVDNVLITFYKTVAGYADRINRCTVAAWFGMGNDSRLFVAGNPDFPNMDWQSGLYDPTYFPDTGYTKVGADSSAIMGYLKQFDNLLVIKSDNEQDATIFKRTAELDAEGKPLFPLKQGVAGVGAVSRHAFGILRDEPLFLAKEGVFATTVGFGDVSQQRYAQERSYFVKARLIREPGLQNAVSAVWNDLYVLCVNGRCYVADGKQKTGKSGTETPGYEWFYWDNVPAVCFMVYADKLYFGTADGRVCMFSADTSVYRFSDDGAAVNAVWATVADDDGDFMRYKTVPKKGSGVMIKPYSRSSVRIYIRTDEVMDTLVKAEGTDAFDFDDVNFEDLTFETSDAPQVIPLGTKIKRYKTLQIIVKNNVLNEGFGVYGIIKRYSAGGYVK